MRTALITGVTGQTGSYLADLLTADGGWDVHGAVRPGDRTLPWDPAVAGAITFHEADLMDEASLRAAVEQTNPDVVFHLGGLTSVGESWSRPVDYARALSIATIVLLDAIEGSSTAFVHASSAEIFGEPAASPQNERTPIAPVSPYGAAKAHAHAAVQIARSRGVAASNMILFNHESPRRPTSFVTRKITSGVAAIARGEQDKLALGNLDARRDWGWAPDYARAICAADDHADDFVIATGVAHSVRDFVEAAFAAVDIVDWQERVELDPRFFRAADATELAGDASHAREVLGWAPSVEFAEIVARMVEVDLH